MMMMVVMIMMWWRVSGMAATSRDGQVTAQNRCGWRWKHPQIWWIATRVFFLLILTAGCRTVSTRQRRNWRIPTASTRRSCHYDNCHFFFFFIVHFWRGGELLVLEFHSKHLNSDFLIEFFFFFLQTGITGKEMVQFSLSLGSRESSEFCLFLQKLGWNWNSFFDKKNQDALISENGFCFCCFRVPFQQQETRTRTTLAHLEEKHRKTQNKTNALHPREWKRRGLNIQIHAVVVGEPKQDFHDLSIGRERERVCFFVSTVRPKHWAIYPWCWKNSTLNGWTAKLLRWIRITSHNYLTDLYLVASSVYRAKKKKKKTGRKAHPRPARMKRESGANSTTTHTYRYI